MKTHRLFIVGAAIVMLACAGCSLFPPVVGSGFLQTSTYALSGFTKIEASHSFKVHAVPDAAFSVTVISDDNLVQYLDVRMSYGTLILALKPEYSYTNVILTAEVHLPALNGIGLSGACEARVDSGFPSVAGMDLGLSGASSANLQALSGNSLHIECSGASSVTIPSLVVSTFSADISGASSVLIAGSAGSQTVTASGASSANLLDCTSGQATVNVSGASKAWVNVPSGSISIDASGASILYYRGSPTFAGLSISGASQIVHLN